MITDQLCGVHDAERFRRTEEYEMIANVETEKQPYALIEHGLPSPDFKVNTGFSAF